MNLCSDSEANYTVKDDIEDNLEVENTNAVKNILSQLNDNDKRNKNPTRKPVQMNMRKYSNMNTNKNTEENEDIKVAKVIKEDKIVSFKDIKMKFERGEDETKDQESKELTPVRKRMMERRL